MSRQPEVDAWFERYDNPMKDVVQRIREIVLDADPRVDECIKWQAPTFTYKGNIASFFPKSKQHASLMFHQGARIPGTLPAPGGRRRHGTVHEDRRPRRGRDRPRGAAVDRAGLVRLAGYRWLTGAISAWPASPARARRRWLPAATAGHP